MDAAYSLAVKVKKPVLFYFFLFCFYPLPHSGVRACTCSKCTAGITARRFLPFTNIVLDRVFWWRDCSHRASFTCTAEASLLTKFISEWGFFCVSVKPAQSGWLLVERFGQGFWLIWQYIVLSVLVEGFCWYSGTLFVLSALGEVICWYHGYLFVLSVLVESCSSRLH